MVEQKKKQMTRLGTLEFAILANIAETPAKSSGRPRPVPIRSCGTRARSSPRGAKSAGTRRTTVRTQKPVYADQGSETVQREVERSGQKVREILVVYEPPETPRHGPIPDPRLSDLRPRRAGTCVGFRSIRPGGQLFGRLTRENAPSADGFHSHLSILLDEQIQSAPVINEPIEGGSGIIEGSFRRWRSTS